MKPISTTVKRALEPLSLAGLHNEVLFLMKIFEIVDPLRLILLHSCLLIDIFLCDCQDEIRSLRQQLRATELQAAQDRIMKDKVK